MIWALASNLVLFGLSVVNAAKYSSTYGGDDSYSGGSSSYSSPSGGGGDYGYATGGGNAYTGVAQAPSKYPPAMTHERNRQLTGYTLPPSAKQFQQKFEGLFDDFPGPKTKAKVYYPGRGYITMQVPVQQPDAYGKGQSYSSSSYSAPSYDDNSYSSGPSYNPAPPPPSYGGSRPSYPAGSANEDDDSPFGYMVKKGYSGSSSSSYSPSPPAYRPPSPSAYNPGPSSYQPPQPSYGGGGPSGGYNGGSGGGGGGGGGYNPSGYKPSSYPSSYPGDADSSGAYPSQDYGNGYRSRPYMR
ncbi:uncharacterized protein LOC129586186 isoform X2 [Paramacrobiotus metropolitanus]|uniref:uncharacterized protein LOC129586186 isoform X2 n=1 Tax=Paramacrobiotus metropolitanus TaxID=2943436 RepID=UPI0024463270|nr:uncharacterized protein LOC129586186 isoform X2 [Paramacrobiotus metropolitanus]